VIYINTFAIGLISIEIKAARPRLLTSVVNAL